MFPERLRLKKKRKKERRIVNEGFLNWKIWQMIGHRPVLILGGVLQYRSLWQKIHNKDRSMNNSYLSPKYEYTQ